MDHTEQCAAAAWQRAETHLRYGWALARLINLRKLGELMAVNDRIDAARGVWAEFVDGQTAANRHEPLSGRELAQQATILTEVARYVLESDVVSYAVRLWGSHEFSIHIDTNTHLTWEPWARIVAIRRIHRGVLESIAVYTDVVVGQPL